MGSSSSTSMSEEDCWMTGVRARDRERLGVRERFLRIFAGAGDEGVGTELGRYSECTDGGELIVVSCLTSGAGSALRRGGVMRVRRGGDRRVGTRLSIELAGIRSM